MPVNKAVINFFFIFSPFSLPMRQSHADKRVTPNYVFTEPSMSALQQKNPFPRLMPRQRIGTQNKLTERYILQVNTYNQLLVA